MTLHDTIKAIREASEGITSPPWKHIPGKKMTWVVSPDCYVYSNRDNDDGEGPHHPDTIQRWNADAEFIALARNNIIALCDRVEAMERENERLKKALEPDMFWDSDNNEQPHYSIAELVNEYHDEGDEGIVEVQQAVQCPDAAYIYRWSVDPESDDREVVVEKLSDDDYKHYKACMGVAYSARQMWHEMVDKRAAELFAQNPGPIPEYYHGRPWAKLDYPHRKYHRSLAQAELSAALQEKPNDQ